MLLLLALSAHIFSAVSAFAQAKQFAGYVRLRRDKLAQLEVEKKPSDASAAPLKGSDVTFV